MVGAYSLGEPLAGSACRHSSQHSIVYVSGDSMECITSTAGVRFPQLALAAAAPACNIALPRIATHSAVINNHIKQHIPYTYFASHNCSAVRANSLLCVTIDMQFPVSCTSVVTAWSASPARRGEATSALQQRTNTCNSTSHTTYKHLHVLSAE